MGCGTPSKPRSNPSSVPRAQTGNAGGLSSGSDNLQTGPPMFCQMPFTRSNERRENQSNFQPIRSTVNGPSENGVRYRFGGIAPQPAGILLAGNSANTRTTLGNRRRFVEDVHPCGRFRRSFGIVPDFRSTLPQGLLLNPVQNIPPPVQNASPPIQNAPPPIQNPPPYYARENQGNGFLLNFGSTWPQGFLINPIQSATLPSQNATPLNQKTTPPSQNATPPSQNASPLSQNAPPQSQNTMPEGHNALPNYRRENLMFNKTAGLTSSIQQPGNYFDSNFIYDGISPNFFNLGHAYEMIPVAFCLGQQNGSSPQVHVSVNTNHNAGIRTTGIRITHTGKFPTAARKSKKRLSENSSEAGESHLPTVTKLPLCLLCEDNEREIVFLPCGHLVTCKQCGTRVKSTCPVCRNQITHKIKTYIS